MFFVFALAILRKFLLLFVELSKIGDPVPCFVTMLSATLLAKFASSFNATANYHNALIVAGESIKFAIY